MLLLFAYFKITDLILNSNNSSQLWFVHATRHWATVYTCLVKILHALKIFVIIFSLLNIQKAMQLSFLSFLQPSFSLTLWSKIFSMVLVPFFASLVITTPKAVSNHLTSSLHLPSVGDFIHPYSFDCCLLQKPFPNMYSCSFPLFSELKLFPSTVHFVLLLPDNPLPNSTFHLQKQFVYKSCSSI